MAHEIEGAKFFCVGSKAWHGIGQVLNAAPTPAEAHDLTGGHGVALLDVYAGINGEYEQADGYKAVTRDDGKVLSVMSDRYGVVQPADFWSDLIPFLETGLCEIESGGILQGGKKMFGTLKIRDGVRDVVPGDSVKAYVRGVTSFDGSSNHEFGTNNERIVCANTLAIAQNERGGFLFKIRHTRNMRDRIELAKDSISQILADLGRSVDAYRALAAKAMTRPQMVTYLRNVFEYDPDADNSPRAQNKMRTIEDLIDSQRGLELVPAVRGTAWQAYNAATDYLSHYYGHNADSRIVANYLGEAARINNRALQMALAA